MTNKKTSLKRKLDSNVNILNDRIYCTLFSWSILSRWFISALLGCHQRNFTWPLLNVTLRFLVRHQEILKYDQTSFRHFFSCPLYLYKVVLLGIYYTISKKILPTEHLSLFRAYAIQDHCIFLAETFLWIVISLWRLVAKFSRFTAWFWKYTRHSEIQIHLQ